MCDFYSAILPLVGPHKNKVLHLSTNSHSGIVSHFGVPENTYIKTNYVELENDCKGELSIENIVKDRIGFNINLLTNAQCKAILTRYTMVASFVNGKRKTLPCAEGIDHWDVYLATLYRLDGKNADYIRRKYMTITGGDGAVLVGGYGAIVTGGYEATVTGGKYSTVTGGNGATVTGGYRATATGGIGATVTGNAYATLIGGDCAIVAGGYGATVAGGHGAVLILLDGCGRRNVAKVDGKRIKSNTPYKLVKGQFRRTTKTGDK